MATGEFTPSSPKKLSCPRGIFPNSMEDVSPMATHGQGTLANLIKSRPCTQHSSEHFQHYMQRRSLTYGEEAHTVLCTDRDESHHEFRGSGERRLESMLHGPQIRSQRLIGQSNSRYKWESYWKTKEELNKFRKPIREYYERTNRLIQHYIYIDRLLDSSLPHDLLNEYNDVTSHEALRDVIVLPPSAAEKNCLKSSDTAITPIKKIKRTPRELYKVSNENTPLLDPQQGGENSVLYIPGPEDEDIQIGDRIVQVAIYVNLVSNVLLLGSKVATILLTNSLSVLASLVDAALDLLSTGIIWTTTKLIERQDHYSYPIGKRRLEPIGVLVFSVIMITSFFQVGLQCLGRLNSGDHTIIKLAFPAIITMVTTVFAKLLCWLWCRMVKNSGVQALAQDAMTDVIFNTFSIIFPLVGFYAKLWWLDALGGLLLSLYIVINWSITSAGHIRNLTGAAATADERNVLLYLTMRFAKTIKQIQGLQAYHCGDKLNVEVDVVMDEQMTLRDSHDLGESLQYVLESVPMVDRAFVHQDYASWNLPTHMQQQGE
ncbi:Metal tolerance protein 3 [Golovinomyces cichoracearum]|uniref:Metal tolerance protein 3 n=1 Tax=Golovinomyces cichoracearum TaxID=62708 RepID=A0A420JAC0_9PEZI|nr:Metal tolerance protein 3 [Golovinomyces cichoracearum]